MSHSPSRTLRCLVTATLIAAMGATPAALAQQAAAARPADKPPIAQGWIDIATFSSPGGMAGMAAMMGGAGGNTPMSALFGGNKKGNQFGLTQAGGSGSYVDVTLRTSLNPNLAEAVQSVPPGTRLEPTLQLKVPPQAKPVPERGDDTIEEPGEPPKARFKLYWGCGTTIRPGQPKVADLQNSTIKEFGDIFKGRRATQRGAHSAPGRPVWPNPVDNRLVPTGASFAGAHAFSGQGVPESFRFTLPPAQDIMPAIALQQAQAAGVTQLSWQALPTARGYFIAAMGGKGDGDTAEMILWTSSELPDSGFGLIDYQTNKSVDQWLKEKVLLAPTTTRCDVPKGIFGAGEEASGAMLRMIAYGTELNLAYPPRPTDPKLAWEPEWALKVRVKSVATAMLGMPSMDDAGGATGEDGSAAGGEGSSTDGTTPPAEPKKKKKFGLKDMIDAAKEAVPLPH
jgi:hypothetical protein